MAPERSERLRLGIGAHRERFEVDELFDSAVDGVGGWRLEQLFADARSRAGEAERLDAQDELLEGDALHLGSLVPVQDVVVAVAREEVHCDALTHAPGAAPALARVGAAHSDVLERRHPPRRVKGVLLHAPRVHNEADVVNRDARLADVGCNDHLCDALGSAAKHEPLVLRRHAAVQRQNPLAIRRRAKLARAHEHLLERLNLLEAGHKHQNRVRHSPRVGRSGAWGGGRRRRRLFSSAATRCGARALLGPFCCARGPAAQLHPLQNLDD
mmetsp:Transcript_31138/g.101472  ORF Transcript_31138/g.101472 Transcript_31138/m.101472 type:complete len:270 (+) Transcript_31138:1265-2074(+)